MYNGVARIAMVEGYSRTLDTEKALRHSQVHRVQLHADDLYWLPEMLQLADHGAAAHAQTGRARGGLRERLGRRVSRRRRLRPHPERVSLGATRARPGQAGHHSRPAKREDHAQSNLAPMSVGVLFESHYSSQKRVVSSF